MSWLAATLAGAVSLAAAPLAVTRPNAVHALLFLVAGLVSLAAAFFALGAAFAGAVQILICAGAVVAVFGFVVMTIDTSSAAIAAERARPASGWRAPALLAALAVVPVAAMALGNGEPGRPRRPSSPGVISASSCSGPGRGARARLAPPPCRPSRPAPPRPTVRGRRAGGGTMTGHGLTLVLVLSAGLFAIGLACAASS